MTHYQIFSDPKLDADVFETLKKEVAPAGTIVAAKVVASVLSQGAPDPAFAAADIAFGQPFLESIHTSEKLKWIHLSTAGFTRYDTPEFRKHVAKRGLIVTNSSSVYARACAEHVFAFMLAQARALPASLRSRVPNGSPKHLLLRESCQTLHGQKVVILGYGTIASTLVEMLKPFEMDVVAMRRSPRGDEGVPVVTLEDLPDAMAKADHVIDILPDNSESVGFFDAARFSQMKPGAVFYNIGRGTTVNQNALYDALRSEHLEAAWLDVTDPEPLPDDHPLWTLENCHITPHTAGGYRNESLAMVNHFVRNFRRFLRGEPLADRVM